MWLKSLIQRLRCFPNFKDIWNTALKMAKSEIALSKDQLTMRFVVEGKTKEFNCNSRNNNKFPRFLFSEFMPEVE